MKFNILLFITFFNSYIFAKNIPKDTLQMEVAVITGTKTTTTQRTLPFGATTVGKNTLEQSGKYNVLPVLSMQVPGLFVSQRNIIGFGVSNGAAGRISIRGVSGDNYSPNTNVLVLMDGTPQYMGIFGHPLSDTYSSANAERVEVIRGPASFLYGSNAMGGVINIITKQQKEDGFHGNINASYGSFNTQTYSANLNYKFKKFYINAATSYDKTDGYRDSSEFNSQSAFVKMGYQINKIFNISADYNYTTFEASDTLLGKNNFKIDISRQKLGLNLDNRTEKLEGGIKLYFNKGHNDLSDGWKSDDNQLGISLFETVKLFKNNSLTVGFDGKQISGLGNGGAVKDTTKTMTEKAIYTHIRQQIFSNLNVHAGIRYEINSVFGDEWIPYTGFAFNAKENITFKGSISKGFRSPTLMELYYFVPNINLKPERMINYELSYIQTFMDKKLETEFTIFYLEGSNMIQVIAPPPRRMNIGTFYHGGVEFSGKYLVSNHLSLGGNYSFLNTDKPVMAAPKHMANFNIFYNMKQIQLMLTTQYVSDLVTEAGKFTTDKQPDLISYTLLNLRATYKIYKQIEIYGGIDNLLNEKYYINYGYEMPGLTMYAGARARF